MAGFNAGDETRFYIISSPALDLDINSNVNKPGKWLFRIDSDSIALPANSSEFDHCSTVGIVHIKYRRFWLIRKNSINSTDLCT